MGKWGQEACSPAQRRGPGITVGIGAQLQCSVGRSQSLGTDGAWGHPRLSDSAPSGMVGPLGYSFASSRARSHTLPSDSLVLSLQVTEAPWEQVTTAG